MLQTNWDERESEILVERKVMIPSVLISHGLKAKKKMMMGG
jgi:hypothetical protein